MTGVPNQIPGHNQPVHSTPAPAPKAPDKETITGRLVLESGITKSITRSKEGEENRGRITAQYPTINGTSQKTEQPRVLVATEGQKNRLLGVLAEVYEEEKKTEELVGVLKGLGMTKEGDQQIEQIERWAGECDFLSTTTSMNLSDKEKASFSKGMKNLLAVKTAKDRASALRNLKQAKTHISDALTSLENDQYEVQEFVENMLIEIQAEIQVVEREVQDSKTVGAFKEFATTERTQADILDRIITEVNTNLREQFPKAYEMAKGRIEYMANVAKGSEKLAKLLENFVREIDQATSREEVHDLISKVFQEINESKEIQNYLKNLEECAVSFQKAQELQGDLNKIEGFADWQKGLDIKNAYLGLFTSASGNLVIQRAPRMILLAKELLKTIPDNADVQSFLGTAQKTTELANEKKRMHDLENILKDLGESGKKLGLDDRGDIIVKEESYAIVEKRRSRSGESIKTVQNVLEQLTRFQELGLTIRPLFGQLMGNEWVGLVVANSRGKLDHLIQKLTWTKAQPKTDEPIIHKVTLGSRSLATNKAQRVANSSIIAEPEGKEEERSSEALSELFPNISPLPTSTTSEPTPPLTPPKEDAKLSELFEKCQSRRIKKPFPELFARIQELQKIRTSTEQIKKIMDDLDKNTTFVRRMKKSPDLNKIRNQIIIDLYGGSTQSRELSKLLERISADNMEKLGVSGKSAGGHTVEFSHIAPKENMERLSEYGRDVARLLTKDYVPYFDLVREIVSTGKFIPRISDNLRGLIVGLIELSNNAERKTALKNAWQTGDKALPLDGDEVGRLIGETITELNEEIKNWWEKIGNTTPSVDSVFENKVVWNSLKAMCQKQFCMELPNLMEDLVKGSEMDDDRKAIEHFRRMVAEYINDPDAENFINVGAKELNPHKEKINSLLDQEITDENAAELRNNIQEAFADFKTLAFRGQLWGGIINNFRATLP